MILAISKYIRLITLILLPGLLVLSVQAPSVGQTKVEEEGRTSNVRWTTRGDVISINYDLSGSPGSKFAVKITMRNESDSTFAVVPRTIDGDLGESVAPGVDREIQWYFRRDYPLGFSGRGYFFEIQVSKTEEKSNLLFYVVGAAAVVGGIVAIIVSQDQPTGAPPPGDLPSPPPRP